jgi:hypothetical protein
LVKKESYSFASKFYEQVFSWNPTIPGAGFAQVWFDFKRDILYLAGDTFVDQFSGLDGQVDPFYGDFSVPDEGFWSPTYVGLNKISEKDVRRVQNLALDLEICSATRDGNSTAQWIAETLGCFGAVKKLYAIPEHSMINELDCVECHNMFEDLKFWELENEGYQSLKKISTRLAGEGR